MNTSLSILVVCASISAGPSPDEMAGKIDALIAANLQVERVTPSPECSDEDFLRRVTLDITAELPGPADITRFGIDFDETKREAVIDRLVDSRAADARWARYWTETVFSRATNARSVVARPSFESWLTEELGNNTGWDKIVSEMVTATGEVRENGATGLIFAHDGDAAEVASETSRLFTGIQMSCANCHDHPSDQWKRTQFHELAAYFPRVRVRQDRSEGRPKFFVESQDRDRGNPADRIAQLMRLDRNRDGKLTSQEVSVFPRAKDGFERILSYADADGDDALTLKEIENAPRPQQRNNDIEHFMGDLNDPTSKGDRMQPVFFATNDRLAVGSTDQERRSALARSLTSSRNEWFAKSLVNRYWHELMGEGFYMPVDDLGPGREPMQPEVLQALAGAFQRNNFDLRWLLKTITRTEAYQRQLSEPESIDFTAGTTALAATRLDADQIYGALRGALNVSRLGNRGQRNVGPYVVPSFERTAFGTVFGEDPSTPKVDVLGSIPQALALMNASFVEQGISSKGRTRLAELLQDFSDNNDVAIELYLAVLGREPNDQELTTVRDYVAESGSRGEGFEDVYWSLINSAEFLNRR